MNIWKSPVGNKSDIIILEDRWFYNGVVLSINKFMIPEIHRKYVGKCLIVNEEKQFEGERVEEEGEENPYKGIIDQLKEWNSEIKIR